MNRFLIAFIFVVVLVSAVHAQSAGDPAKIEIFAGYSNLQAEGIPDSNNLNWTGFTDNSFFGNRSGLHGVEVAATKYFWGSLGLTGDFSFNQRNRSFFTTSGGGASSLNTRVINVLGGPTYAFRRMGRITPFVHGLAGIANTRFKAESSTVLTTGTTTNSFSTNATDFALALGGGLDVKLSERISVRAFQADWNPVFLRDRSISILEQTGVIQPQVLSGQRQDNLRFSFGVVFK